MKHNITKGKDKSEDNSMTLMTQRIKELEDIIYGLRKQIDHKSQDNKTKQNIEESKDVWANIDIIEVLDTAVVTPELEFGNKKATKEPIQNIGKKRINPIVPSINTVGACNKMVKMLKCVLFELKDIFQ